ncbi:cysteine and histidine-rich protein 1 homolog [Drosophila madeirensis]|uniref:Cysteine and histidine-rich protein 1 homolog n=1 Tax=Drosophila madeirensis TaxID=30013 RepID=A0AAU9FLY5_DROMD
MSNASANPNNNDEPPAAKRPRLSDVENTNENEPNGTLSTMESSVRGGASDLHKRLYNLLLCVVCREVPHPEESYQCKHGHIMCEDCTNHILADAMITDKDAHCPSCRVCINCHDLEQNLVVRQALWELPIECASCAVELSVAKELPKHLKFDCELRVVRCKYQCLGCSWEGTLKDRELSHDAACAFPQRNGKDIMKFLQLANAKVRLSNVPLMKLLRELSASRINFRNVIMSRIPNRDSISSDFLREFVLLESETITAFEEQWVLRLHLTTAGERRALSCQLLLLSTPRGALMVDHMIRIPQGVGSVKQQHDIRLQLYRQLFDANNQGEGRRELPLEGPQSLYRLFAMNEIQLRLWMFLHY